MSGQQRASLVGLVAPKGRAAPALADQPEQAKAAALPPAPKAEAGDEKLVPLNFKMPEAFQREFKAYAAQHGLKMNKLLEACFAAYRKQDGG